MVGRWIIPNCSFPTFTVYIYITLVTILYLFSYEQAKITTIVAELGIHFFIGMKFNNKSSAWEWTDGDVVEYTHWAEFEPGSFISSYLSLYLNVYLSTSIHLTYDLFIYLSI